MIAQRRLLAPVVLAIIAMLALRIAVMIALPQPVASDSAAYMAMATSLAKGGPMHDLFGSVAFYSPGYPLLLAAPFALFSATPAVALAINLGLAAVTALMIHRLALRLAGDRRAALIATSAYALWLPSLLATATLAKENLTTPLLLGFAHAMLSLIDTRRPLATATIAGLCYGAGVLAGASSLLIAASVALALIMRRRRHGATITGAAIAFSLATAAIIGPWLVHTSATFGHPVLTTNSGFNLYLGNNPAATGDFVSIADTPVGPDWHRMRETLGEEGSARALGEQARAYMRAHPGRTAQLAALKLVRFWTPNVPDANEQGTIVKAAIRWSDVAQHVLIVVLGSYGLWQCRRNPDAALLAAIITSFWAVHAATYVIVRYREPIMPIMIVFAALALSSGLSRQAARS